MNPDIGPGSLVEYVDDSGCIKWPDEIYPVLGHVYTVRKVTFYGEMVGLLLEEIVNEPHQYADAFGERTFSIHRFRPIDHRPEFTEWLEALPTEPVPVA